MDTDERGYPCYNPAKKRIEELILGKEVKLETDTEDKDQYNRRLRFIFLNGKNINLQLVEEGMAVARFVKGEKYKSEILAAEKRARAAKLGCKWGEQILEEPEEEKEEKVDISGLGYECNSNIYNCPDFKTHAEAQSVYELCGGVANDIHLLDRDKDGLACETLP